MSNTIIKVENLSKKYIISHEDGKQANNKTLRDAISNVGKSIASKITGADSKDVNRSKREDFWALQDISFDIQRGDRVGVIGRNGAGKSTLFKILSRIVEPSAGRISIRGRVSSLLEVGTGFHQELSGRENIYLNGAILGMSRWEIQRKFDEIIEFAEVANFLDTPVKKYSSGMYMRLAFSVAAHLDPEILIVDEVLAVGDIEFQKKCLGKMQSVSKEEGRTILFVSHNMDAIQRLCSKCLMLEKGKLVANDQTNNVISQYLSSDLVNASPNNWIDLSHCNRSGNGEVRFAAFQYNSLNENTNLRPYPDGRLEFMIALESQESRSVSSLAISIYDMFGNKLVNADTVSLEQSIFLKQGRNIVKLNIEELHLNVGLYIVGFWLADISGGVVLDRIDSACDIEVVDHVSNGFKARPHSDSSITCKFSVSVTE